MFNPSGAITGTAVTGLTSPTYTVTSDLPPPGKPAKQFAVTALGGTQTDVSIHSVGAPFAVVLHRPATFKGLNPVNPVTGQIGTVPKNVWRMLVFKAATPLTGQPPAICQIRTEFVIPAGVDTADPNEVRALFSFYSGLLVNQANGITESFLTGLL